MCKKWDDDDYGDGDGGVENPALPISLNTDSSLAIYKKFCD